MHTIMLRNRPRKGSSGNSFIIQVVGDSPVKADVQAAIQELEHHPAKASQRSLIDMLGLIERFNFKICYTEHTTTEDDLEAWSFILQG